jgi:hypothetical protein
MPVLRIGALLVAGALGACGGSDTKPEVVVADAGASPVVIGATADHVIWKSNAVVSAGSLASLPATGKQLATAAGPVAHAGSYVLLSADQTLSRVSLDGLVERIASVTPDALAGNTNVPPVAAWTSGADVSWGVDGVEMMATLTRIDRCDHASVTGRFIYVAADGGSGRRLIRIDRQSAEITPATSSSTWAAMFPNGGAAGATYRGRIAAADDDGALWLVEEMPTNRGIVVSVPVQGEPVVVLEHLSGASGFFVTEAALYWQEDDALLSAPLAGGPAEIVATLPGSAGALADGFVYFAHGAAIERLRVE